jgi:hypothetical protein
MKLLFRKNEESEISVFQSVNEVENEFTYVAMVKSLIADGQMEEPVISVGFSEAEATSIKRMVKFINEKVLAVVADTSEEEPD